MADEGKKKTVKKGNTDSKSKAKSTSSNQKKTSQKKSVKSTSSLSIRKKASVHSSQEKLERTLMLQQISLNSMTDSKTRAKEKAVEKSRKANSNNKKNKEATVIKDKSSIDTKKNEQVTAKKSSSKKKDAVNVKAKAKKKIVDNKKVIEEKKDISKKENVKKVAEKKETKKTSKISNKKSNKNVSSMPLRMKKIIIGIVICCVVVLLLEGVYFLILKNNKKTVTYYDSLNALTLDDTDIVAVGSSNFEKSEYNESTNGLEKAKLVKYDKYGNVLFEKMFSDGINSTFNSIISVEDGYVAVGSFEKDQTQTDNQLRDALIIKYDKEGNIVWQKTFSSLADSSFTKVIEAGGGYIVIGQSIYANMDVGNSTEGGGVIMKYSKDGEVLWESFHGGTKSAIFNAVAEVNGDFYVVGKDGTDFGNLVKFSSDGKYQWHKNYRYTDSLGFSDITFLGDKLYVVGGKKVFNYEVTDESNRDTDNTNGLLIAYSLDGEIHFEKTFGGSNQERYNSITNYHNDLFVVGISNSSDSGLRIFTDGTLMTGILIKYDVNGNIEKKNVFGGTNQDVLTDVVTDNSNLYMTAYTNSKDGNIIIGRDNGRDYFGRLIKVDSRVRTLFLK